MCSLDHGRLAISRLHWGWRQCSLVLLTADAVFHSILYCMSPSRSGHHSNPRARAFMHDIPRCPMCNSSSKLLLPCGMEGKMFLIVSDSHSKWIEVIPMVTATSFTTIQRLTQFGIPETIVSDNGTQFSSSEFQQFCQASGIHHIRVSPYRPSSNGLAERTMRIFKQGLKRDTQGTLSDRIAKLLFTTVIYLIQQQV